MELLGDVCQMDARFDLFGGCVNLGARSVHGLRRMYMGMGVILRRLMELLGDLGQV
jgi:hypothetical protein